MQKVKLKSFNKEYNCMVFYDRYQEGGHRIDLIDISDGIPVATVTVNVPGINLLGNEVVIKNYSENEGIYDTLIEQGIIKKTNKSIQLSEYVVAPIATIVKKI